MDTQSAPNLRGERRRKPDPRTAMLEMIAEARSLLVRAGEAASVCTGDCSDCSVKQVEALAVLVADWESRLATGEQPTLGELHRFGRLGQAVRASLERQEVLGATGSSR
jgi:hypothetical protein